MLSCLSLSLSRRRRRRSQAQIERAMQANYRKQKRPPEVGAAQTKQTLAGRDMESGIWLACLALAHLHVLHVRQTTSVGFHRSTCARAAASVSVRESAAESQSQPAGRPDRARHSQLRLSWAPPILCLPLPPPSGQFVISPANLGRAPTRTSQAKNLERVWRDL